MQKIPALTYELIAPFHPIRASSICTLLFGLLLSLFSTATSAATREYALTVDRREVTVGDITAPKITVNGTIPGPTLHFTEGDDAVIHVTNALDEMTSIHWHGLVIPGDQDGAPGFNGFAGIAPGETFTYRFKIRQAGTYWYHSHSMGQEQDGLYSGMVIAPRGGEPAHTDRDYVVLFSDFSKEAADTILGNLKKSSEYYQHHRRTLGEFIAETARDGLSKTASWGRMRMLPTDLADVAGYQFLLNGKTNEQNWTGLFKPGERIRLRFINASAMTMYDLRIPGLKMTVIAADGQPVTPVAVDELRFGNAETYDVIVTPRANKAYSIVAESIDREGFALGTLAPREGMREAPPAHRPRARLTMADMNMDVMMQEDPDMDMSSMHEPSGWAETGAPEGTRILTYADLRSLTPQPDTRKPTRDIAVRLGGNMERYIWTMNGKKFDPKDGIEVGYNERVRLTYINETMMAHPVHLHGMFTQLENGAPMAHLPNKHTVIVPPGQTLSMLLTADNQGDWPIHCHLFFHMASGMMTTVRVAPAGTTPPPPTAQPEQPAHGDHHHGH